AQAAVERGHKVALVTGPVALVPPIGVKTIRVISAIEMLSASRSEFDRCDAAIFTAAVCDYRPVHRARLKQPKRSGGWSLELTPTPDIAATLAAQKKKQLCVAFALEDHNGRLHAERKLTRKSCDAIVLNGRGNIGADRARVQFLEAGSKWENW